MIKKINPDSETKVKVLTDKYEYNLSFEPEDILDDDDDDSQGLSDDDISGFFG